MNWTPEELQAIVDEHALVLFMKGTPENAQCGFSNRAAQVMQSFGEPFASVDVLSDPKAIPSICAWSDFPTMPQVFVHGELIGQHLAQTTSGSPVGFLPCKTRSTVRFDTSTPQTVKPASWKPIAVGNPTYPRPMIPIVSIAFPTNYSYSLVLIKKSIVM